MVDITDLIRIYLAALDRFFQPPSFFLHLETMKSSNWWDNLPCTTRIPKYTPRSSVRGMPKVWLRWSAICFTVFLLVNNLDFWVFAFFPLSVHNSFIMLAIIVAWRAEASSNKSRSSVKNAWETPGLYLDTLKAFQSPHSTADPLT